MIQADGWELHSIRGSHRQFTHPTKKGRVTIPGHPSDEIGRGTPKSILQQAHLIESEDK